MSPWKFFRLIKSAAVAWNENNAPSTGAAIAYYTVFSMAPLLLLAITIASLVFGKEAARGEMASQFRQTIGSSAGDAVITMLDNANQAGGQTGVTVFGVAILLLGASGVFVQLQQSLNTVWKAEAPPRQGNAVIHFLKNRFLSFAAVVVTGFLLLVSLVVSSALAALSHWLTSFPGSWLLWQALALLVSFCFITLMFALIFKMLPDLPLEWRDVWIGAVLTAVLFTLGQQLIGLYLGQTSPASAYGAAGSLVVLLLWVYYSAQIVLFGAEFTHAYATAHGSKCGADTNVHTAIREDDARKAIAQH